MQQHDVDLPDWPKLIDELMAAGVTQVEMAAQAGCGQPTISDLYRGRNVSTGYEIGSTLVKLHAIHVKLARPKKLTPLG